MERGGVDVMELSFSTASVSCHTSILARWRSVGVQYKAIHGV
jgi:hypothetical protein